jgi:dTDP-4-dehydrorhamnose 3,5-epimerase
MIKDVIIKEIIKNHDERGFLAELFRDDELDFKGTMAYASFTNPDIIRGPHEHVYQSDCFVFLGPGSFILHLWDRRDNSTTNGEKMEIEVGENHPCLVIVPPGVVHGYKCISDIPALSLNFPDKLYKGWEKREEVDEIRWEKNIDSPYQIK